MPSHRPLRTTDTDVVVIGSGLGGLTAALCLARAGKRVEVFEQHTLPGGYAQSFALHGHQFSPGIHYVGELQPGGRLRQLLTGLGIGGHLGFRELNRDGFDHVVAGDRRFDIPAGRDRFAERMADTFPEDRKGILDVHRIFRRLNAEQHGVSETEGTGWLTRALRLPATVRWGIRPLGRLLERHIADPFARAVLSAQCGDHGLGPRRALTAIHAAVMGHYAEGAYYPEGGGRVIPAALLRGLRAHGGAITLRAPVERILLREGRAVGVRLTDGQEISATTVVSNADPGVTWNSLVGREHTPASTRRRLAATHYSVSAITLFGAVARDLRRDGLDSGNVWYSRSNDIDAVYDLAQAPDLGQVDEIPGLFLAIPTLKDPDSFKHGHHTIEAIAFVSHRQFERWAHSSAEKRPADYLAFKERLSEQMWAALDRLVPGIRKDVVASDLSTPISNVHFVNATEGNIYGTETTLRQRGPFAFPYKTPIPGLFQCGASTFVPGVLGASSSGVEAAARVLGCAAGELLDPTGTAPTIRPAEPDAPVANG